MLCDVIRASLSGTFVPHAGKHKDARPQRQTAQSTPRSSGPPRHLGEAPLKELPSSEKKKRRDKFLTNSSTRPDTETTTSELPWDKTGLHTTVVLNVRFSEALSDSGHVRARRHPCLQHVRNWHAHTNRVGRQVRSTTAPSDLG